MKNQNITNNHKATKNNISPSNDFIQNINQFLYKIMILLQEAIKQALTHGDRMVQAKCLLNFAEIHRERLDFQVGLFSRALNNIRWYKLVVKAYNFFIPPCYHVSDQLVVIRNVTFLPILLRGSTHDMNFL